jgi:hypothetical protein
MQAAWFFSTIKKNEEAGHAGFMGLGLITVATFADVRGFRSFPRLLS